MSRVAPGGDSIPFSSSLGSSDPADHLQSAESFVLYAKYAVLIAYGALQGAVHVAADQLQKSSRKTLPNGQTLGTQIGGLY